ncbi:MULTISPECIES: YbhB/YbcL family Raf kinase inhibitor-like protein [unclassified Aliivibrio]|uniref:YbhB/YbcL family Raf kinase inhibitor-like protein n=1 Tax=unclassified Aliivibrio TaxID=2645654 RepID=UPI00080E2FBA|nr:MULTISPECIES: YbhB/YbcL family Raf kinase inhibitor-like protein [unclassified Aliivibrio]OCH15025.1 kinase inhibitor [Aliivibrio sp. 1S128]OCH16040.1 kinase inhibitor [Aliivibrio sp. 1S165]OCH26919.1 kinase inhibitor [Aliivibrio sp. 1S175]
MNKALLVLLTLASFSSQAFEVSSKDIHEGQLMNSEFTFSGMGCTGANISPQLSWKDAPEGTKSFAITVFDPDAPTGSGWWHWLALNIPANVSSVAQGSPMKDILQTKNDFGTMSYGGACPPAGDGMHRYQYTVWALPQEKIDLPADISPAVVGYTLNSMALDKAVLTATYVR